MQVSIDDVGAIIAFILPGIVAMLGLSYFSSTVRLWLGKTKGETPTIGGALFLILASLAVGLLLDAVRIQIIEPIHHLTGIHQPTWTFSQLQEDKFQQFEGIVESHYRFHQFYANFFLALILVYISRLLSLKLWPWPVGRWEFGTVALLSMTWIASRNELAASYRAITELLT